MNIIENKFTSWFFGLSLVKKTLYKLLLILPAVEEKLKETNIRILKIKKGKTNDDPLPLVIWSYWEGPESACGNACYKSWLNYAKKFEINLLTPDSLANYLPDFPLIHEEVPVQLKSDLIRLFLLERFGGVWMDYSILMTRNICPVLSILDKNSGDVLLFYNELEYKSDHSRPVIENGFIAAKKNQDFIKKWRMCHQEVILSKNWRGYYRERPDYEDLVRNFKTADEDLIDYLVCYTSAQKVMRDGHQSNLVLLNSEDDYYSFRYQLRSPLRSFKIANRLLLSKIDNLENTPVFIKLTGGNRRVVDEYIKYSCVREDSFLGQYLVKRN